MKESMYTYHYFLHRAIKRPYRIDGLIFQLVLLSAVAYMFMALYLNL